MGNPEVRNEIIDSAISDLNITKQEYNNIQQSLNDPKTDPVRAILDAVESAEGRKYLLDKDGMMIPRLSDQALEDLFDNLQKNIKEDMSSSDIFEYIKTITLTQEEIKNIQWYLKENNHYKNVAEDLSQIDGLFQEGTSQAFYNKIHKIKYDKDGKEYKEAKENRVEGSGVIEQDIHNIFYTNGENYKEGNFTEKYKGVSTDIKKEEELDKYIDGLQEEIKNNKKNVEKGGSPYEFKLIGLEIIPTVPKIKTLTGLFKYAPNIANQLFTKTDALKRLHRKIEKAYDNRSSVDRIDNIEGKSQYDYLTLPDWDSEGKRHYKHYKISTNPETGKLEDMEVDGFTYDRVGEIQNALNDYIAKSNLEAVYKKANKQLQIQAKERSQELLKKIQVGLSERGENISTIGNVSISEPKINVKEIGFSTNIKYATRKKIDNEDPQNN